MKTKVNVKQVLTTYDGKPMFMEVQKRGDDGKKIMRVDQKGNEVEVLEEQEYTFREAVSSALLASDPQEVRTGKDKDAADKIGRKIWSGKKEVSFTSTQVTYIVERVEKFLNPRLVGLIKEILGELEEEKEEEEEKKEKEAGA